MSLNDDKHSKLLTDLLLTEGAVSDLLPEWLAVKLSVVNDTDRADLWRRFFDQAGIIPGTFNERADSWLASLGHNAQTLQEKWAQFWAAP